MQGILAPLPVEQRAKLPYLKKRGLAVPHPHVPPTRISVPRLLSANGGRHRADGGVAERKLCSHGRPLSAPCPRRPIAPGTPAASTSSAKLMMCQGSPISERAT